MYSNLSSSALAQRGFSLCFTLLFPRSPRCTGLTLRRAGQGGQAELSWHGALLQSLTCSAHRQTLMPTATHAHGHEPIGLSVCGVSNTTYERSPCLREAAGAQPSSPGNLPGAACTDGLMESNYPRLPTSLPSFQNKHTISTRKISVAIYTSALIFLPSFLPSNYRIRGREKRGWPFG